MCRIPTQAIPQQPPSYTPDSAAVLRPRSSTRPLMPAGAKAGPQSHPKSEAALRTKL